MRKKPKKLKRKLKKKTQNSRKKFNVSEDCPSPDLPSDVKKKAWLTCMTVVAPDVLFIHTAGKDTHFLNASRPEIIKTLHMKGLAKFFLSSLLNEE